jgi:RHS repeat-associated protein
MKNRSFSAANYRYGFNNQEKDAEMGEAYAFEYRIHDARLGRFLSVDPVRDKYVYYTTYQFAGNVPVLMIDLEGLEPATPAMQQMALQLVLDFENSATLETKWTKIGKIDYCFTLRNWLYNSSSINQANTNLCGIAVACKAMIEYDPESFVKLGLNLYQNGSSEANSFIHTDIEANETLYNKMPSNGLDDVGFVTLTSVRNSYNLGLPYDPQTDKGLAGLTYPGDISDFLTSFANLEDVSHQYTTDNTGLNKALTDKAFIIGLFDIDQLTTGSPNPDMLQRSFGNHYVQITSYSEDDNGAVTMKYWNWGESEERTVHTTRENFAKALKNHTIINRKSDEE